MWRASRPSPSSFPRQELSAQTSHYFETVTSAVAEEGGTIYKFIGDSVMALWGAPTVTEDHVFRACVAALRASRRMEQVNARWAAEGRKQMRVRFGVHCDTVVVGNVGSRARLSYTVMGDGVNVAARIEGLNKNSVLDPRQRRRGPPGVRPHQCSSSWTGAREGP